MACHVGTSTVKSSGNDAAAARRSAVLNESRRRLPEIPIRFPNAPPTKVAQGAVATRRVRRILSDCEASELADAISAAKLHGAIAFLARRRLDTERGGGQWLMSPHEPIHLRLGPAVPDQPADIHSGSG